jgi:hypothetical protein
LYFGISLRMDDGVNTLQGLPSNTDCSSKDSIKDGACPSWHKVLVVQKGTC